MSVLLKNPTHKKNSKNPNFLSEKMLKKDMESSYKMLEMLHLITSLKSKAKEIDNLCEETQCCPNMSMKELIPFCSYYFLHKSKFSFEDIFSK